MPNVRVGVGGIVVKDGCLLMVRRAGSHGVGTWCPPGGHQEWGEPPEKTAEREIFEETGVTVVATRRLPYTNDYTAEWDTHYITLFILCDYVYGEACVTEPAKCPEVEWVPLSEVKNRELFAPLKTLISEHPEWQQLLSQSDKDTWLMLAGATAMAAAIDLMVYRRALDERSLPADARLAFGDPMPEEKALEVLKEMRIIR